MITPPVGGAKHALKPKHLIQLLSFSLGATLSATALGIVAGMLGSLMQIDKLPLLRIGMLSIVAMFSLTYGLAELFGFKLVVPTRHWIIPQSWNFFGSPRFELAFGLALGLGFLTVVPFIGYYLLLAMCFVTADPISGGILMMVFGMSRAMPVLFTPLVMGIKKGTYSNVSAYHANRWFAEASRHWSVSLLRSATLFATAGLAIAVGFIRG